jgi:hypothetical protein
MPTLRTNNTVIPATGLAVGHLHGHRRSLVTGCHCHCHRLRRGTRVRRLPAPDSGQNAGTPARGRIMYTKYYMCCSTLNAVVVVTCQVTCHLTPARSSPICARAGRGGLG